MYKEQIRIKIDNKYYKITIEEEKEEENNTNTSSSSNLSLTLVTQNNQKIELELIGDNEKNYVERHNKWRQSSHQIKTDSLNSLLFFLLNLLFPFLSTESSQESSKKQNTDNSSEQTDSDLTQLVRDCLAEHNNETSNSKPKSPSQK